MAEEKDPKSKTEEATPRKLDEARKKGDVAKTPDLACWLSLMGASAVILIGGGWFASRMAAELMPFLAQPHAMVDALHAGAGVEIGARALWASAPLLGALALATIVGGAGGNLAQSGFLFTAEKLKPKLEKISPLKGAQADLRARRPDAVRQDVPEAGRHRRHRLGGAEAPHPRAGVPGGHDAGRDPAHGPRSRRGHPRRRPGLSGRHRLRRLSVAAPPLRPAHADDPRGAEGGLQAVRGRPARQGQAEADPRPDAAASA